MSAPSSRQAAIVTGASDGIGRALAVSFARRGLSVGLLARREGLLREVAEECRRAGAPAAEISVTDVTDTTAFRAALGDLDQRLGGASVFVANAGVFLDRVEGDDQGDVARRIFEINLTAAVIGLEWMKARMLKRGGGHLAAVGSVAGARGLPFAGTYSATKAGLHAYLEALRAEMRYRNIKVTTVEPGFIATALNQASKNPRPFLMPADRAGEIFVRAILAGRSHIMAPWIWIPAYWLLRAMPDFVYDRLVALTIKKK